MPRKKNFPALAPLVAIVVATVSGGSVVVANAAEPDSGERYDVNKVLAREREKREAEASDLFYNGPRDDTFSFSFSGAYLFGMHGSTNGGDGWSASLTGLVHISPSDAPNFRFLIGGELFGFCASSDKHGVDTDVQSLNFVITAGCSYDFSKYLSCGCLLGYGLVGGSRRDMDFHGGGSDVGGTMTTVLSIRPYVEVLLNRNVSVFLGYRFFYASPSIFSSAAGWSEIEVASHSVELGVRFSF